MSCQSCFDPDDGTRIYPHYGVGPHLCFYKIPGATLGQSELLPQTDWPANYEEDPGAPGHGVWWCPECGYGKPCAGDCGEISLPAINP